MAQQISQSATTTNVPKTNWFKVGGAVFSIITWFVIFTIPMEGITIQGKGILATFAAAIILWISQPIPMAYTAVLAMVVPWILQFTKSEVALSGFASSTFWLIFAALGMGTCVMQAGYAKRFALWLLSIVGKPTYTKVLTVIFVVTFVLSYAIPAGMAKALVVLAIFLPFVYLFGVKIQSNIGKAITLSTTLVAYAGTQLLPTSVVPALIYGALTQAGFNVNFQQWTVLALFPTLIVFVCMYFFTLRWIKPERNEAEGGREAIEEQRKALPPMTTKEIWGIIVTVLILVGWILDPVLKLGTTQVAMMGICLFLLPKIGVMSFSDFVKTAIPWEVMLLIGSILGLSAMVASSGIAPVLSAAILPIFTFAKSPILLMLSLMVLNILMYGAFILMPTLPVLTPAIIKASLAVGLNPLVGAQMFLSLAPLWAFWGWATLLAVVFKDNAVSLKEWVIGGVAYVVFWLIAWLITLYTWVPLLGAIGLLPK